MKFQYLFRQLPVFSAEPFMIIDHCVCEYGDEVLEKAVFLLANNKYVYIRYYGLIADELSGATIIHECDNKPEAEEMFNEK